MLLFKILKIQHSEILGVPRNLVSKVYGFGTLGEWD